MNLQTSANINLLWSRLIVEELLRCGVESFCVAPGSRSGPLAVAVAHNPRARALIHFDERGLGFHALGHAAATNKPVAVITTSGTAVANLFPAVIEASKKKLPLVILTADRPPELRKTGANQTIDQPGIFGEYVRFHFDMPCPTAEIPPEFVLTTVDQAVYRSLSALRGPVHLNCMYREPLAPLTQRKKFTEYLKTIHAWQKSGGPYTRYVAPKKSLTVGDLKSVAAALNHIRRGIIVVGKLGDAAECQAALKLARRLKWPIFADIASGLRLGKTDKIVVPYFDHILLSEKLRRRLKIDGVLHLGGRVSSRRWYAFVDNAKLSAYVMVLNHPLRNDPLHGVSIRVEASVAEFTRAVSRLLKHRRDQTLVTLCQRACKTVSATFDDQLKGEASASEPAVARMISRLLPGRSGLFLASSLPVREMDMYACAGISRAVVQSNRGASGIDGTVAAAAGFASGLNRAVTLLIGDLALLHDINSLPLAKAARKPLVIVVLNNDGGGIFSFLPIAKFGNVLNKFFTVAHGLTFEHAAGLFQIDYHLADTTGAFREAYRRAVRKPGATLIEVRTDTRQNVELQRRIQAAVRRQLDKL